MSDTMKPERAFVIASKLIINKTADDVFADYKNNVEAYKNYDKYALVSFFINKFVMRANDYLLGVVSTISLFEVLDDQKSDLIKQELIAHINQTAKDIGIRLKEMN